MSQDFEGSFIEQKKSLNLPGHGIVRNRLQKQARYRAQIQFLLLKKIDCRCSLGHTWLVHSEKLVFPFRCATNCLLVTEKTIYIFETIL